MGTVRNWFTALISIKITSILSTLFHENLIWHWFYLIKWTIIECNQNINLNISFSCALQMCIMYKVLSKDCTPIQVYFLFIKIKCLSYKKIVNIRYSKKPNMVLKIHIPHFKHERGRIQMLNTIFVIKFNVCYFQAQKWGHFANGLCGTQCNFILYLNILSKHDDRTSTYH